MSALPTSLAIHLVPTSVIANSHAEASQRFVGYQAE